MTFKPSPQQADFYNWVETGRGNCILEAVAGAGKTTTLVTGLEKMRGRVWLGAYNSKMAKELKERVEQVKARTGRRDIFAATFHSAGYGQLRFSFKQHRLEIDDKKVPTIVTRYVEQGRTHLEGAEPTIAKIVSMAKNRGFGALVRMTDRAAWEEMVYHFDLDRDLPDGMDLAPVITAAHDVLNLSNGDLDAIDFDDMIYLPILRKLRMLKHDWVLVDEAQDTNPVRRALARELLSPNGRLVAVGDPHQAIFGFTGADNDSLEQIERDFNAIRMPLSVTYRCPKAIVSLAQEFVSHIHAHESAPEGAVEELEYDQIVVEIDPTDAIICRQNAPLVDLCFRLIRNGIAAKIEGRAIGEQLAKLAGRWKTKKSDPRDAMEQLLDNLEKYRDREVEKAMAKNQEDRADRINDQVETLRVLIDRALGQGITALPGLVSMIKSMFEDDVATKGIVTLCSVHKSKGLEWDRVFLLGRHSLMPSRFAVQEWQVEQEINLIYVAVTRAKKTLVEVALPAKKEGE